MVRGLESCYRQVLLTMVLTGAALLTLCDCFAWT
jgi:hypothetical protein